MAVNKVVYGDEVLIDLTPTTAEAGDVAEGKTFMSKSGTLTTGTLVSGTSDYENLNNKPKINNVELIGNKTTSDLGIVIPTVPTKLSSFTDDLGNNPIHTHSQYLTSETEPMFNSSVAKGITSSDITNWNNKSTFSGNYNDLTNKPDIPDSLSDLTDDSTHRLVSDTEKTTWNNKSNFSGSYNDLTDKPTIPTNYITTDTAQDNITGDKTFKSVVKIQNGQGTGSLWIGGNVNNNTLTNNNRHLARISVPSYSDITLGTTLLGFDSSGDSDMNVSNKSYDVVSFGGMKKITNATSPMAIGFCVANTRGGTSANNKVYPLEMDATSVRFNVKPNYNGNNLATESYVDNIVGDIETLLGGI